jgi:uncharacterized protein (UPF0332 family)
MHAAKAALLGHDIIAESHAAVRRLFGQVLVGAEGVEQEWAQILARGHAQRGAAEYNVEFVVDEAATERLVRDAQRFVRRMGNYASSLKGIGCHLDEHRRAQDRALERTRHSRADLSA